MKREIRFRAWDKITKTMRTNILSIDVGEYGRNIYFSTGSYLLQIDAELMQYTGIKDKNGVEIYKNDYLEIPEVSDNSKTWCVFWGSGKYILQNISTGDILDCNETNTRNKTIIGNTFESPREHKAMASDL